MSDHSSNALAELSAEVRRRIFIVIPAYNEAVCLADVVRHVRARYPHVVVVDDGSSDATFEVAMSAAGHALRHVVNRGQGAALQTGIEFSLRAGASVIVTFDADGQHCVDDIARLVRPILAGESDITLGSRFLGEPVDMPPLRRLLLRGAVCFTRIVSRVKLTDAHNGLRAFSRRAASCVDITLDRMAHASELIDQIRDSGLPFCEVPVTVRYTAYSLAKGQSAGGAFRIVIDYIMRRLVP